MLLPHVPASSSNQRRLGMAPIIFVLDWIYLSSEGLCTGNHASSPNCRRSSWDEFHEVIPHRWQRALARHPLLGAINQSVTYRWGYERYATGVSPRLQISTATGPQLGLDSCQCRFAGDMLILSHATYWYRTMCSWLKLVRQWSASR